MPVKLKLANSNEVGAPKPSKASKKNKKSWRKNVDMTEVNVNIYANVWVC